MIEFERTRDYKLIRSIVTHPRVYRPSIVSDAAPAREDFTVDEDERIWYVLVKERHIPIGFFMLVPETEDRWYLHVCFLPIGWGSSAVRAGRKLAPWLRYHSRCKTLCAAIPVYNRLAVHFAERCGAVYAGLSPRSIKKDGRFYDQALFEKKVTQ
jgi:RimJ/RimL family protein N-acetyltransferase